MAGGDPTTDPVVIEAAQKILKSDKDWLTYNPWNRAAATIARAILLHYEQEKAAVDGQTSRAEYIPE